MMLHEIIMMMLTMMRNFMTVINNYRKL